MPSTSSYLTNEQASDFDFVSSQIKGTCAFKSISSCPQAGRSFAYDLDNKVIVRFPKNEECHAEYGHEAKVLSFLKEKLDFSIPQTEEIRQEFPFFIHDKVPGNHLTSDIYNQMKPEIKNRFCSKFADIIHSIHSQTNDVPNDILGIKPSKITDEYRTDDVKEFIDSRNEFSDIEKRNINNFLNNFSDLDHDSDNVFGHFDLRLKNMAYDLSNNDICGLYDFSNAGVKNINLDFYQIALDFDLDTVEKIMANYNKTSGSAVNAHQVQDYALYSCLGWYTKYPNLEDADFIKKNLVRSESRRPS